MTINVLPITIELDITIAMFLIFALWVFRKATDTPEKADTIS